MVEIFHYEFMRNAVLAAVFASIACGVIGSYVVVKKLVSISGGIAHAAFGGVGLGYLFGINPIWTIFPFTLFSSWLLGFVSQKQGISEDSAIGMLWSIGMAIGILCIGLTPGYMPDLFSYLFGNILTVTFADVSLMACLDIFIIGIVFLYYKKFLALSFDKEFAEISGINTNFLYALLLSLVAFTIVILIKIVGIILVIALLAMPASIAKQFSKKFSSMMIWSVVLGLFFTLSGLFISYVFNLASGATIILFAGFVFLVFMGIRKLLRK